MTQKDHWHEPGTTSPFWGIKSRPLHTLHILEAPVSLSQPYGARRVAVVSATTVGVLVALSGAPSPATAQGRPEAPGRSAVLGPAVPTGSFIGPVLGMSPLHSARSTEPLARKFK